MLITFTCSSIAFLIANNNDSRFVVPSLPTIFNGITETLSKVFDKITFVISVPCPFSSVFQSESVKLYPPTILDFSTSEILRPLSITATVTLFF